MNTLTVPESFREKITAVFGEAGTDWLRGLDQRVPATAAKWRLANLHVAPGLSYNLLCFAESPDHGPVALKLGVPCPELFSEMEALAGYGGRGICSCHGSDRELGALLLERILPGEQLWTVSDARERIRLGAGIIAALPVPAPAAHRFPHYGDWIRMAFARVRAEGVAGERLLRLVDTAEPLFAGIDSREQTSVLLHGDLHHGNILRDGSGGWKAIDPKGVIGPACMEPARFIENELGRRELSAAEIIGQMASEMGQPARVVAISTFVDKVLSTCWSMEEQAGAEELRAAVKDCEEILACCGEG